jgi:exopolysaccharide biosynthesis polyprenyl glycosylphosphotransferase
MTDLAMIAIAMVIAYGARFGETSDTADVDYAAVAALITAIWLALLGNAHSYDIRVLGVGSEEFKRIATASFQTFGAVAIVSYVFKLEVARGFVAVAMPVGLVLLLAARIMTRTLIRRQRTVGRSSHQVLVIGDPDGLEELCAQLAREPHAGFRVVAALIVSPDEPAASGVRSGGRSELDLQRLAKLGIPFRRLEGSVVAAARRYDADTVAVTARGAGQHRVRRIAWELEGSSIDLVVAPAVTDVAGPRITVRPVAGLPLLYVDEPTFSGGRRLLKRAVDLGGALALILLLSPLLITVTLAVALTSKGGPLYLQPRSGKDGRIFRCWKFRTMYLDADQRLASVAAGNRAGGLLFKVEDDPRITTVGRFLRRWSIDELPQLFNVLANQMSLVGPRPLAVADDAFEGDERRRLLVKPGMTGLWQVSARVEQSWDDLVRLDLYYVENWSLALDLTILGRTVAAVVRGTGS